MKITERIFDVETGETGEITRDATAKEIADFEAEILRIEQTQAKFKQREQARAVVLQKLGITEEDAKLLLS